MERWNARIKSARKGWEDDVMFKSNGRKPCVFRRFCGLASVALLPLLAGCDPAGPAFGFAWAYDFLALPVRSLTGTALLAFINAN